MENENNTNNENIIEFEKNSREVIRLSLSEYKAKKLIDIRIWYLDKDDEYKPSKKGLSLSIDKFDELKNAILRMEQLIK